MTFHSQPQNLLSVSPIVPLKSREFSILAPIKLPQAGKSATDGTIVRWLKQPGDSVQPGEVLFVFETAEGLVEAEASSAGTLTSILAKPGRTVKIGHPVAEVGAAASQAIPTSTPKEKPMATDASGVVPILMPQAGNSMEEGTILSWKVKEGDRIKAGDIVVEIETDKSTMEVEADADGRVARIVAGEGDIIPVKQAIAYLAENDEEVDAFIEIGGKHAAAPPEMAAVEKPASPQLHAAPAPAGKTESGRVKASPAARKAAAEKGVDLATAAGGSGPYGRILSTDVASAEAPIRAATGQSARRPISKMRRAIAKGLSYSKQNLPHWYLRATIDAGHLFRIYKDEKAKYQVSVNDFVVMACARTLQEFPLMRTQIEGDELVEFPNSNIGIAVGTDDGLVVPVILAVEQMALNQLGSESRRIALAARDGKVSNSGKGVFTISNLGMFGAEEFGAIINPPEAAILAVGAIREQVLVENGAMRPGRVMTMTLSSDHRIVDGTIAARFMARLKEILEAPEQLV